MADFLRFEMRRTDRIRKVGNQLSRTVIRAEGDIAKKGATYIKRNYLRGQAMRKRTGETYNHLKLFYSKKEKAWYIRPGVGVKGSQNYLARYIGTKREFMKPGWASYLAQTDAQGYIARKLQKLIDRNGDMT